MEVLVLSNCVFYRLINLANNKCLRKLVIHHYLATCTLEISAPYVQSLDLLGYIRFPKCKLLNLNSSIDCFLGFYGDKDLIDKDIRRQRLTSLLDDLSQVEAFTIGKWVLQVLSSMMLNELPCPVLFNTVKLLKLRSNFTIDEDMNGVARLLSNLNCLEKLVIEIQYNLQCFVSCFSKQDQDQVCLKNMHYCSSEILKNLKTVEVLGLKEDQDRRFPNHLSTFRLLVEFLLKKAKFLENMIISAQGSMHYIMELKNKFLGFPKSSLCGVVEVIDY